MEVGARMIVGVGRNFAKHARELGNAVPTEPLLFLKPPSSRVQGPEQRVVRVPAKCKNIHHEVELGVVMGRRTHCVAARDALQHVAGYVLALDMTAREMQQRFQAEGKPWAVPKGFDTFCPISEFIPKESIEDHSNVRLWLKVNGEMRQDGNTRDMIFDIPELVEHISAIFTLEAGDLILTGTPDGVGPVVAGDEMQAGLGDLVEMKVLVAQQSKL